MIENLLIVAAVLTAIHGSAVAPGTRNGAMNEYYLFKRDYGNGMEPILMTKYLKSLDSFEVSSEEPTISSTAVPTDPPIYIPLLNPDVNTIVIVHGINGHVMAPFNTEITRAFFDNSRENNDENIIVVDWSSFTGQSYSYAIAAVPSVGHELGRYLAELAAREFINLDRLHLVGFNLGAHVVAFAGRVLNGQAARITGLDPSGNQWGSNSRRLAKGDAKYVEVIHTDGDGLLGNGIGTAIGDADFFVNGGSNQPGCLTHACSHNRAWELFAATLIRDTPLIGNICNSNLQLTLNRCFGSSLNLGGDELFKRPATSGVNIYRVNTGRRYPY